MPRLWLERRRAKLEHALRWHTTGVICYIVQLVANHYLVHYMLTFGAYVLAALVGNQLNFVLRSLFVWRHRHPTMDGIFGRWQGALLVGTSSSFFNGAFQWIVHWLVDPLVIHPNHVVSLLLNAVPALLAGAIMLKYSHWMEANVVYADKQLADD